MATTQDNTYAPAPARQQGSQTQGAQTTVINGATAPVPVAAKQKTPMETSFWTVFGYEFLTAFVITLIFASVFFYDLGLGHGVKYTHSSMPAYVYAAIVGVGLGIVYWIFSGSFGYHVRGTPVLSVTFAAIRVSEVYNNVDTARTQKGWLIAQMFVEILAQLVGGAAAIMLTWLVGAFKINHVQNVIVRDIDEGLPIALSDVELYAPNDAQIVRVFMAETAGYIALTLVAYMSYRLTMHQLTTENKRIVCVWLYGRIIGLTYFMYVLLFWVHAKMTVDPVRAGLFCLVAQFNTQSERCSRIADSWPHASLYLFVLLLHVVISFVSFSLIYIFESSRVEMCRMNKKN